MKKLISLILVFSLALACFCALSEEALTDAMSRITLNVKTVLDIPDDYTDFTGNLSYGSWYLNWQGEDSSVSVMAKPDGTILSYNSYSYTDANNSISNLMNARLPRYTVDALQAIAIDFAERVMVKDAWGYSQNSFLPGLSREYYSETSASGYLTFNGVLTDILYRIEIDNITGKVTNFYRSDAYSELTYPSEAVDNERLVPPSEVRETLLDACEMELLYSVIDPEDMAKLVYVPKSANLLAADAYTGNLIVIDNQISGATSADEDAAEYEGSMDMGYATASKVELSEAERNGIALYEDAKNSSEIDALIRRIPEFDLGNDFRLVSFSYFLRNKLPMAHLVYQKGSERDGYTTKYLTVDAQTGRVVSLNTYSNTDQPLRTSENADTGAIETADAFLRKYYADYTDELLSPTSVVAETAQGNVVSVSFNYFRAYNGFPFRQNSISVSFDKNGFVTDLMVTWNDGQEFYDIAPDAIIPLDTARNSYLGKNSIELMYRSLPLPGDESSNKQTLRLCYSFTGNDLPYAVDAVTSYGYTYGSSGRKPYSYKADEGMLYADEVVLLGRFGIGLEETGFTEDDKLSGEQLMRLVLQTAGYEEGRQLTEAQIETSFKELTGISLKCGKAVSRGDLISTMTVLAGFKNVADLNGIFMLDAEDWAEVPEDMQGCCAVSHALGLMETTDGKLDLNSRALTAQAIHAIYVILSR
ncbi:MAG: hypothetical protein K5663_09210 [Clostridiales bacterium]|nr:hypothetical protein [Clostridiales bacterium]